VRITLRTQVPRGNALGIVPRRRLVASTPERFELTVPLAE